MGFNTNYFLNTNNIFNLKLKPNQFTILSYLIRMTNKSENCYPSMNNIAEMCCVSKSTVVRTIDELQELGYITVDISKEHNTYYINYEKIEETNNRPEKVKKVRTKKSTKKEIESMRGTPIEDIEFGGQIEINDIEVEIDVKTVIEATGETVKRVKEVLKYAKDNNKENVIGFAISAIKNNWSLVEVKTNKPLKHANFTQRDYDYVSLEKQLLGWE